MRTIILNLDEIGSFVSTLAAFFKNLASPSMCFAGSFLAAGSCSKQLNGSRMRPPKSCCLISSVVRGVLTWQRSVRTRQSRQFLLLLLLQHPAALPAVVGQVQGEPRPVIDRCATLTFFGGTRCVLRQVDGRVCDARRLRSQRAAGRGMFFLSQMHLLRLWQHSQQ